MPNPLNGESPLPTRPLEPHEIQLVSWLLEHGVPEARGFAHQLEGVRASSWCECGCPSISLNVEEGVQAATSSQRVISDHVGMTSTDKKIGVLLFQDSGKLSLLEVYELGKTDGAWGFPVIESLQRFEDVGQFIVKDPQTGKFIMRGPQPTKDPC